MVDSGEEEGKQCKGYVKVSQDKSWMVVSWC